MKILLYNQVFDVIKIDQMSDDILNFQINYTLFFCIILCVILAMCRHSEPFVE